jgi:hypothetical protein
MPRQLLRLFADSPRANRRLSFADLAASASCLGATFFGATAIFAAETVDQALVYKPIQAGVVYETPSDADREKCTIEKEVSPKTEKVIGFLVKDGSGRTLRRFVDTDGDKKLDTWSYYKDGIEVYREHGEGPKQGDVVANEFRWLGENGTRFGIDKDKNEKIDEWAVISPEEVSEEFVLTVKLKDAERFGALIISNEEVDILPISAEMKTTMKTRAEKSRKEFASYASKQKLIDAKSTWISFGGIRPMTLALTDQGDVTVYENVSTIFDKDGDPATTDDRADVPLGTLVHLVGENVDAWRMIDLPEGNPFSLSGMRTAERPDENPQAQAPPANEAAIAKHFKNIEQMETKGPANAADFTALAKEYETVLGMIEDGELYENTLIGYGQTLEQGASMTDSAGKVLFPGAVGRLEAVIKTVQNAKHGNKPNLLAFLNYRLTTSKFSVALVDAAAIKEQAKAQKAQVDAMTDHIAALKEHVEKYPEADETPKALNELAVNLENDGSFDEAKKYYQQCAESFATSIHGKLAAGAVRRLGIVGSTVALNGKTLDSKNWTPPKGKPYLIFYYSGQYTQLADEIKGLVEAETKGKKSGLQVVCVALDPTLADATKFAKASNISTKWPVLYADKGMEGKLATDMGIFQAPYVIIVDKDGKGSWQGPGAREAANNLPK